MSGWESSNKRMSQLHNNVVVRYMMLKVGKWYLSRYDVCPGFRRVTRTKLDFTLSTFNKKKIRQF